MYCQQPVGHAQGLSEKVLVTAPESFAELILTPEVRGLRIYLCIPTPQGFA